jgi:hypothetical protein
MDASRPAPKVLIFDLVRVSMVLHANCVSPWRHAPPSSGLAYPSTSPRLPFPARPAPPAQDDCLYRVHAVPRQVLEGIVDYVQAHVRPAELEGEGSPAEKLSQARDFCTTLYLQYGTTLAGLVVSSARGGVH